MVDGRGAAAVRKAGHAGKTTWRTYRAFGLSWRTDLRWPGTATESGDLDADVVVQLVERAEIDSRWSGQADRADWLLGIDGKPLIVERGLGDDFRLSHAERFFHVSADGSSVACATADPDDPWWQRLLLDTVLWTTALLRGIEALHASAVEGPHGVVAFLSRSGGGKTTMALEFLRRGHRLFCDDVLALRRAEGRVMAFPSPPFMNVPVVRAPDPTLAIRPIAILGDEIWSAALRPSRQPAALAHLVILDRGHESGVEISAKQSSLFELRHFCLDHGLISDRERARFDLCADLAAQVPVSHLRAGLATRPDELADLIEAALERPIRAAQ